MTSALEQLYHQVILDHARERYGFGLAGQFDGKSHQVNPICGDEVTVAVTLDAAETISQLSWEGSGCSISTAATSVLAELVSGAPAAQADDLHELFVKLMHGRGTALEPETMEQLGDAAAFTGVARYPARIKCALLGWMALRDALAQALAKTTKETTDD